MHVAFQSLLAAARNHLANDDVLERKVRAIHLGCL